MKLIQNSEINLFEGALDIDAVFRKNLYETDENQEQGLYTFNLTDVVKKLVNWHAKLPRVKPFYAVKCNNDEKIIKLLAKLGAGFDCASEAEIEAVLKHGVTPERIIFANPAKPTSHIEYAKKTNTNLIVFDSMVELERIHRIYPTARLVLRIRYDASIVLCSFGRKFGCDPKVEAPRLLQHAKKLGMEVVGVSFHVGTRCKEPLVYGEAIGAARDVFDQAVALGYRFSLLDIGGGFPGDTETDFGQFANAVNSALDKFFPENEFKDVEVIAEPGTYFVESAGTIGVTVYSKNEILSSDEKDVEHVKYYVNDGIHGCFNLVVFGHDSFIPRVLERSFANGEDKRPLIDCSIWGQSLNGADKISDNLTLPNVAVGDVLLFPNVGNYSFVLATNFNGFPNARILYFADYETMKILGSI